MDRIVVAQQLLDALGGGNYLEIGVSTGSSFIPIRAKKKWGVDPAYLLSKKRRLKYVAFATLGLKSEAVFRMKSDDFFSEKKAMLERNGISVCLVDGLHTYEQSLSDILNALSYLEPNGVILVHDCNPATELIGLPASNIDRLIEQGVPDWDGSWSGDVWKTIVHLRSLRKDLDTFVLDCDTGLGVVTRRPSQSTLSYSDSEIRNMDYQFLARDRKRLLSLQPPEYFQTFLSGFQKQLTASSAIK